MALREDQVLRKPWYWRSEVGILVGALCISHANCASAHCGRLTHRLGISQGMTALETMLYDYLYPTARRVKCYTTGTSGEKHD